jgi:hypothetical protein
MSDKAKLLEEFELFRGNGGGIEGWLTETIPEKVVDVLLACEKQPLSREVLNQLLILSHEAGVSRGFFQFYFCYDPHPSGESWYDPKNFAEFDPVYLGSKEIVSLRHLKWGLRRLYTDALLYFGNIRQAYRYLRSKGKPTIGDFFREHLFDAKAMTSRGASLRLENIARDDRYLIAEIACKTYEPPDRDTPQLIDFMRDRYRQAMDSGRKNITVRDLVSSGPTQDKYTAEQLAFSLDEVLDSPITTEQEIEAALIPIRDKFQGARTLALKNTELYLSMIADLDVYVATGMRNRSDFRSMADFCSAVFRDPKLAELKLRYFDPTVSAAVGMKTRA